MSRAIATFRRQEIETRIEELIALLDLIDGDPDLEETGDEHDVSAVTCTGRWGWRVNEQSEDDEDGADDEAEESDADLGWLECINQASAHRFSGVEGDDEREPNGDETDFTRAEDEFGSQSSDFRHHH